MDKGLLIFAKKPVPGKVKTRLAKDIGNEAACKIYRQLLFYTFDIAEKANVYVLACLTEEDQITLNAVPFTEFYQQVDGNLGKKLDHAFQSAFERGFKKLIVLGTDCADLTTDIIQDAYEKLDQNDVVIGPAKDGGYYLLGMTHYIPSLFENKSWSTEYLLTETTQTLKEENKSYHLLETLSDIDNIEDLKNTKNKLIKWHHHI